jgi:hypothetical protein
LNINGYVGLSSLTAGLVELYPNPSNGQLFIKGMEAGEIEIYSITGKCVFKEHYSAGKILDLSNLYSGMYVVYGHSASGVFVEKLNLQK